MWFAKHKSEMVDVPDALPGRDTPMPVPTAHFVNGNPLKGPYPAGLETAIFGFGCFWGAERIFWQAPGVYTTAVGYAGGFTPNPTYEEVCGGRTGHAEVVEVEYDPGRVSYEQLLDVFWENHDPTTLNRQGPDVGEQYRSAVYFHDADQEAAARASKQELEKSGRHRRPVVTEITAAAPFWRAEDYHQQYLEKRGLASCKI